MSTASLNDLPFVDLYIRLDQDERPLYRPKNREQMNLSLFVPDDYLGTVQSLIEQIKQGMKDEAEGVIEFQGLRFRLSRQKMADDSVWVCARRVSITIPDLDKLGFLPSILTHMRTLGQRDGLILVSGSTAQGKTTTAVALLASYLRQYGGMAVTIEDPVEYLLKGRHGEFGQCFQMETRTDDDWALFLKRALRWSPRYVYVGEVRTPQAAEHMLRAATTGHTVITTLHAGTIEEALMDLLFFAEQSMGPSAREILANGLSGIVHQQLTDKGPYVRYLFTEANAHGDPIRALIRENKIGMMSTYIDRIASRLGTSAEAINSLKKK